MLGWIRNLLGIRKDVADFEKVKIDTLKSELEVDKLEDEASARNLITRATLDDVKKYDPKVRRLRRKIDHDHNRDEWKELLPSPSPPSPVRWWIPVLLIAAFIVIIFGLVKLILRFFR